MSLLSLSLVCLSSFFDRFRAASCPRAHRASLSLSLFLSLSLSLSLAPFHRSAREDIITVPSQNLSIVSIGTSEGWSDSCWGGYDDSFSIALVWAALAKAVTPPPGFVPHPDVAATRAPLPPRARPSRAAHHAAHPGTSHHAEPPPAGQTWIGSCACACGPGQGFGKCFNVASGSPPPVAKDCASFKSDGASFYNRQRDFCPQAGFPVQCNYPADASVDLCTATNHPYDGNCTQIFGELSFMYRYISRESCSQFDSLPLTYLAIPSSACSPLEGAPGLATAACSCDGSVDFGRSCTWSDKSCDGNPYFPPGMALGTRGSSRARKRMVY